MPGRVAEDILKGLNEVLLLVRGQASVPPDRIHIPPEWDVRRIRGAMDLSREAFAEAFNMPVQLIEDWEEGRRVPDEPARAYLRVIERAPDAVQKALQAA